MYFLYIVELTVIIFMHRANLRSYGKFFILYISAHLHLQRVLPPCRWPEWSLLLMTAKALPGISRTLPRVSAPEVEAAIGEDTPPAMDTTIDVIVIPEQRHQIHFMH